jgi:hypothetical protein
MEVCQCVSVQVPGAEERGVGEPKDAAVAAADAETDAEEQEEGKS